MSEPCSCVFPPAMLGAEVSKLLHLIVVMINIHASMKDSSLVPQPSLTIRHESFPPQETYIPPPPLPPALPPVPQTRSL